MHCYAPNFEEVEGANWFGPVRLSVHLPSHQSSLTFFFFFWGGGGGGSGGAKVLGKLSVPGRPTNLDDSRARAYCA